MDNRYRNNDRNRYGRQQEQFSDDDRQYDERGSRGQRDWSYDDRQQRQYSQGSASRSQYGSGDRYQQGGGYNAMDDYEQPYQGNAGYGERSRSFSRDDDYGSSGRGYQSRGQEFGRGSYSGGEGFGGGMFRDDSYSRDDRYDRYDGSDYRGGDSYGRGRSEDRYSSRSYGGRDDYRRDDDRGFFERAGDKIASWFGDDDARRRDEGHRGRGPGNYKRSDQRVLEDVCDHLTEDYALDASNIEVTVQDGEVTLDGTVSSRSEKRRAEDCAERISGVKHVQNNLRVKERDYGSGSSSYGSQQTYGSTGSSSQTGLTESSGVRKDPNATNKATGSGSGTTA